MAISTFPNPVKKITLSALTISLLSPLAIRRPAPAGTLPSPNGPGMSVITLNMAKETDIDKIISELRAFRDVDMLLLQEVKQDHGQRQCSAEQIAALLGLHVAYSPAERIANFIFMRPAAR